MRAFNLPALRRQREVSLCESEASLLYTVTLFIVRRLLLAHLGQRSSHSANWRRRVGDGRRHTKGQGLDLLFREPRIQRRVLSSIHRLNAKSGETQVQ